MQGNGDCISREAAREAVWQILNGMGYSEKHNNRLVEEIDAVFDDISAADAIESMSEAYSKLSRHMDDLAALMPRWIPVTERLPELHDAEYLDEVTGELIRYKESKPIMIWLEKGGFMDIGVYEKSDAVDDFCYQGVPATVTYWQPLPEPPKEGET